MERNDPNILGISPGEHEATGSSPKDRPQTPETHRRSKRQPSSSSNLSPDFWRLKKPFNPREAEEAPSQSDDGDILYVDSEADKTNEQMPEFKAGSAVNPDSGMDATEHQNSGGASRSDSLDSDLMEASDDDSDHLIQAAKEKGVDDCSKWCSTCHRVAEGMMKGHDYLPVGTWQDIQSRAGCPSCDTIFKLASRFGPTELDGRLVLFQKSLGTPESYTIEMIPEQYEDKPVSLAPLNRTIGSDGMGVVLDPDWFDIARLKKWLSFCDENHGDGCHSMPIGRNFISTGPRYLIDVDQGCLIETHGGERYFALSYVWGIQPAGGKATKENIESLKERGTIAVGNAAFRLPRTIEGAIDLTRMLGERFLWVDRLCIIQDDMENWHSQIKKMGSIYANAYCTFIASGGSDADHGVAGLNQHSGPRQMPPRTLINFPSLQMMEVHLTPASVFSSWYHRGWTFQELKLARRALFFNNDIRWTCQQSEWQEDLAAEPEGIASSESLMSGEFATHLRVEPWPDFVQWGHLVSSYCSRKFRVEGEAGAAFAGIEEVLSRSFPGGFCFGMPEFYFDIALLWWPLYPLQRRSSEPTSDRSFGLPSWSFLGWKEGTPCASHGVGFAYEWLSILDPSDPVSLCSTSSIVPTVDWVQKGPSGQERRIRNDYHVWKKRQEQQPPEAHSRLGWKVNGNDWINSAIPHHRFRYPVQLGFQTVDDTYHTWPPSLCLRSQSTFLKISRVLKPKYLPAQCVCVEVVTCKDEWAGLLHLNTSGLQDLPFGQRCELVSLSCGNVSNDDEYAHSWLEEWGSEGRPKESETYEFYNVMWIKRVDTYVVREAIGRVEKTVWDSQDLEKIDVELR